MNFCKFAFVVLFLFSSDAMAATNYVSLSGSHESPYTSWETAATSIQDAVDAAVTPGDTVLVSNGTYYLTSQIIVTNDVTVQSVNGADVTIVDGQDNRRGFFLAGSAVISGFTITRGIEAAFGGGIYFDHGGTARNCTIQYRQYPAVVPDYRWKDRLPSGLELTVH